MRIASVVGARPQFVKMAAVSRAFACYNRQRRAGELLEEAIIHTGQHYDRGMSRVFFEELEIPEPCENLGVGSASHAAQTGEILKRLEKVLLARRAGAVLVYGDTNSTLAGALTAAKLHIPVVHVEAGLRSYRKEMPEEINRVLTDHASSILFCPTEGAVENLRREGFRNVVHGGSLAPLGSGEPDLDFSLDAPLVINVGDVMFDSVFHCLSLAERKAGFLEGLGLAGGDYYLATVHRAENTDHRERLEEIFTAFKQIAAAGQVVVCPLHPRTRSALAGLATHRWPQNLRLLEPVSYLEMLLLEKNAQLVLTDSGGVQKEAFILERPLITLRDETEWTETVSLGRNVLTGASRQRILDAVARFRSEARPKSGQAPYGDGRAAGRIVRVLSSMVGKAA